MGGMQCTPHDVEVGMMVDDNISESTSPGKNLNNHGLRVVGIIVCLV